MQARRRLGFRCGRRGLSLPLSMAARESPERGRPKRPRGGATTSATNSETKNRNGVGPAGQRLGLGRARVENGAGEARECGRRSGRPTQIGRLTNNVTFGPLQSAITIGPSICDPTADIDRRRKHAGGEREADGWGPPVSRRRGARATGLHSDWAGCEKEWV